MLTKLTKEMEELMFQVRADWTNLVLHSGKDLKEEEIEEDIRWIYKKGGLGEPYIFILDSHLEQRRKVSNFIENSMGKLVGEEMDKKVWGPWIGEMLEQIEKEVKREVYDVVERGVWWSVEREVWRQVWREVENQVGREVWGEIWEDVWKVFEGRGLSFIGQVFGLGVESGLLSYVDYYRIIGIVENEDLLRYMNMHRKGIWDIVYFDKAVFIAKLPLKVNKDEDGRLHSASEPAVQWRDGNCNYFLHGVSFEEELWRDITRGKMSVKEMLKIEDRQKRYAALSTCEPERLLEEFKPKLIDEWRGIKLYKITGLIEGRDVNLAEYKCPSTGKRYVRYVPPECNSAKAYKAWMFSITEEECDSLKYES